MKNKNVLRKKKDFSNLYKNKKCFYSSFFTIYLTENNLNYARIAISVNKKNEKTAVNRNKIKRQIRNICRESNVNNLSVDMIIFPKKGFLNVKYLNKKEDFFKIIKKFH